MRRRPRIVLGIARCGALALLMVAAPAFAGGTDLLTLTREALINDPTYSAARYTQLAAIEAVPQARSNLLPNVSASLGDAANRYDFRSENQLLLPSFEKTFNSWGPALN
ncbi:MAG TPA: hypothetical protein VEI29_05825, partial [Burkholderiaceae bacterium]|nr:hypothetical protein [Burkholderiaceae bacterium]